MNRDKAFRRHNNERVIKNREKQVIANKGGACTKYRNQLAKNKPYNCGIPGCVHCSKFDKKGIHKKRLAERKIED